MIVLLLILGLLASLLGIAGSATDADDPIRTERVPAPGPVARIGLERTGGFEYRELRAIVDDPQEVAALVALLPAELPRVDGPTGVCADCWVYRIELVPAGGGEPIVLAFDQATQPPELDAFVRAVDEALE